MIAPSVFMLTHCGAVALHLMHCLSTCRNVVFSSPCSTCHFRPGQMGLAPASFHVGWLFLQDYPATLNSDRATFTDRSQTKHTDHRHSPRAGHEPVCLVLAWASSTACALLEFAEAPTHILRVSCSVDIGIITIASLALDIAALCLSSWPAAIRCLASATVSPASRQLAHVSCQRIIVK